jgi:hypothetical protein
MIRLLSGALTWPFLQWRRIHRKFKVGVLIQFAIIVANAATTMLIVVAITTIHAVFTHHPQQQSQAQSEREIAVRFLGHPVII